MEEVLKVGLLPSLLELQVLVVPLLDKLPLLLLSLIGWAGSGVKTFCFLFERRELLLIPLSLL